MRTFATLCALFTLAGCSDGGNADEDGGMDAAVELDAGGDVDAGEEDKDADIVEADGSWVVDSGSDAGEQPDAGEADAGEEDAGPTIDAGTGMCATNADCAETEFCAASACGAIGVCAWRPEICIALYRPVCGCDGNTYSNDCSARSAGQNVAYTGPCACRIPPSGSCCFRDDQCTPGMHCSGEECIEGGEGTCVADVSAGECWDSDDCTLGACIGARRCPCGALCALADAPGTCEAP